MPFLRNTWYVAAHAGKLDDGVTSRMICNEQIAMYRNSNGTIAAIEDRCPHRFVPLSMGRRVGDSLQCGYHGLRFDGSGACVEAPNDGEGQLSRACVKAYPAVERDALIWLWMGETDRADPGAIPRFTFLDDIDRFTCCRGYSYIEGNYQLIADNLLDLSHIHYLHPHIHQGSSFSDFTNKVQRDGDTIWSMLWRHHYHVDAAQRPFFGMAGEAEDVEGQGHARWDAPGVLFVDTAWWDHGTGYAEGVQTPNAHLISPETETTSHYFWASGRNFARDSEAVTEATAAAMKHVFETQDGPMVEAQQRAMGGSSDFLDHKPIILQAGAAGVLARRVLMQKIRAENKARRGAIQEAAE